MKSLSRNIVLIGIGLLIVAGVGRRSGGGSSQNGSCCPGLPLAAFAAESPSAQAPAKAVLPRLVDLGADKCIPCKMMMPVLADLKTNYVGQLEVEFIDVWKNPDAGKPYKISLIPTQIFFDAKGKELFRHEGFFAKADIVAKWKELGVELGSSKGKGENTK